MASSSVEALLFLRFEVLPDASKRLLPAAGHPPSHLGHTCLAHGPHSADPVRAKALTTLTLLLQRQFQACRLERPAFDEMEEPLGSDDEGPCSASEPSSPASSGEVAVLGRSDRSDGSNSDQEEGETSDSSPEKATRCVLTAGWFRVHPGICHD